MKKNVCYEIRIFCSGVMIAFTAARWDLKLAVLCRLCWGWRAKNLNSVQHPETRFWSYFCLFQNGTRILLEHVPRKKKQKFRRNWYSFTIDFKIFSTKSKTMESSKNYKSDFLYNLFFYKNICKYSFCLISSCHCWGYPAFIDTKWTDAMELF